MSTAGNDFLPLLDDNMEYVRVEFTKRSRRLQYSQPKLQSPLEDYNSVNVKIDVQNTDPLNVEITVGDEMFVYNDDTEPQLAIGNPQPSSDGPDESVVDKFSPWVRAYVADKVILSQKPVRVTNLKKLPDESYYYEATSKGRGELLEEFKLVEPDREEVRDTAKKLLDKVQSINATDVTVFVPAIIRTETKAEWVVAKQDEITDRAGATNAMEEETGEETRLAVSQKIPDAAVVYSDLKLAQEDQREAFRSIVMNIFSIGAADIDTTLINLYQETFQLDNTKKNSEIFDIDTLSEFRKKRRTKPISERESKVKEIIGLEDEMARELATKELNKAEIQSVVDIFEKLPSVYQENKTYRVNASKVYYRGRGDTWKQFVYKKAKDVEEKLEKVRENDKDKLADLVKRQSEKTDAPPTSNDNRVWIEVEKSGISTEIIKSILQERITKSAEDAIAVYKLLIKDNYRDWLNYLPEFLTKKDETTFLELVAPPDEAPALTVTSRGAKFRPNSIHNLFDRKALGGDITSKRDGRQIIELAAMALFKWSGNGPQDRFEDVEFSDGEDEDNNIVSTE
jgi:hypothetical protein